jgi:hypothetical protein
MHMALYMALVHLWASQGYPDAVEVSARTLMPLAKIGALHPYHRSIKQLHAWRYIYYEPSFNPRIASRVYLG